MTYNKKCLHRSLVELGNDELDEVKADELVDSLFRNTTYGEKDRLNFDDFSAILSDYEKELNYASLDINGKYFYKVFRQILELFFRQLSILNWYIYASK